MLRSNRDYEFRWWTPPWSHYPKYHNSMSAILNRKSVFRILMATVFLTLTIVGLVKLAFPLLELKQLLVFLIQVPGLFLVFAFVGKVYQFFPEMIDVNAKRLLVTHGNRPFRLESDHIESLVAVRFAHDKIRLRVHYSRNGRRRSQTFGLQHPYHASVIGSILRLPVRELAHASLPRSRISN